jgi:hypothetical protein
LSEPSVDNLDGKITHTVMANLFVWIYLKRCGV